MIEIAEGEKVGECTAVSRYPNERGAVVWLFQCSCGGRFAYRASKALSLVKKGRTFTCFQCRERIKAATP